MRIIDRENRAADALAPESARRFRRTMADDAHWRAGRGGLLAHIRWPRICIATTIKTKDFNGILSTEGADVIVGAQLRHLFRELQRAGFDMSRAWADYKTGQIIAPRWASVDFDHNRVAQAMTRAGVALDKEVRQAFRETNLDPFWEKLDGRIKRGPAYWATLGTNRHSVELADKVARALHETDHLTTMPPTSGERAQVNLLRGADGLARRLIDFVGTESPLLQQAGSRHTLSRRAIRVLTKTDDNLAALRHAFATRLQLPLNDATIQAAKYHLKIRSVFAPHPYSEPQRGVDRELAAAEYGFLAYDVRGVNERNLDAVCRAIGAAPDVARDRRHATDRRSRNSVRKGRRSAEDQPATESGGFATVASKAITGVFARASSFESPWRWRKRRAALLRAEEAARSGFDEVTHWLESKVESVQAQLVRAGIDGHTIRMGDDAFFVFDKPPDPKRLATALAQLPSELRATPVLPEHYSSGKIEHTGLSDEIRRRFSLEKAIHKELVGRIPEEELEQLSATVVPKTDRGPIWHADLIVAGGFDPKHQARLEAALDATVEEHGFKPGRVIIGEFQAEASAR